MSSSPYHRLFDLIPELIDPETGIISHVFSLPRQVNMPDFMYYKALVSNTGIYDGEDNFSVAGGTAIHRERALAKAIGEAVERYSSGLYFFNDLPFGDYQTFVNQATPPNLFIPYNDLAYQNPDFGLHPFRENTPIHWSIANNLTKKQEVLVPAAFVYCPYSPNLEKGEVQIAEQISTGLAAHMSYSEAALNGTLEVVERDSFMLFWLSGQAPQKIDMNSITAHHSELIRRFTNCGYEIQLFNITSDAGIPTILAAMKGSYSLKVPFLVAAACHMNPVQAASKCLEELALIERYAKRVMINANDWYPYASKNKIHNLIDHIRYWLDPQIVPKSQFIYQSREYIRLNDMEDLSTGNTEEDLTIIKNKIFESGHEIIIADITSPDVNSLGMKVVRSIIPGYLTLNKRYVCRPIESIRLQKYLKSKGDSIGLNSLPHPFA